jgi:hypothetical protein
MRCAALILVSAFMCRRRTEPLETAPSSPALRPASHEKLLPLVSAFIRRLLIAFDAGIKTGDRWVHKNGNCEPLSYQSGVCGLFRSIQTLTGTVKGVSPLLQNNPQTVDRFNKYTQAMARINAKKTKRTDDDYRELQDIEVRAKIYFDPDLGIYVPSTWVTSAIAANSFRTIKTSKADIRGAVFATEPRLKLTYRGAEKVKQPEDIVGNSQFRTSLTLKQGQVRVVKAAPIFHDWSFRFLLEFDDKIIDPGSLEHVIKYSAKYGGFGDFRPTYGRAEAEVTHG